MKKKKMLLPMKTFTRVWGEVEARKKSFHASIFIHLRNTLKFNVNTSQYKNMNLTASASSIFLITHYQYKSWNRVQLIIS